jgi:glucoamylase
MGDTAFSQGDKIIAYDDQIYSSLLFSTGVEEKTSGFYGTAEGFDQLKQSGKLGKPFSEAKGGNVIQIAKIKSPSRFTVFLSFAHAEGAAFIFAVMSKAKGFAKARAAYEKGWADYVKALPKVDPKYQARFNMAAMILKAHEDKTHRGANVASLTIPWGGGANANENNVGGYHLVWARDLYQVATAFMALGDKAAAERALDFLFNVQQKPDGSFPQNSWLDGKPFWNSLQMDEVAFPLILAYQLGKNDKATYENHIKKAADFIVKNGPATPQERWEEKGGYSPSTIAAEIAGLVCAADIAKKNGDEASAKLYLATADNWQANVEKWTATTTGKYGDGNYYLRITQNGKPDAGDKIEVNSGAGMFDEREIVDAGFLELVRLGVKAPDDSLIAKSVKVIDQIIKVDTPNGPGFYRYNHDGYGEMDDGRRWNFDGKYTGKGRLWALLSGERGEYELAIEQFPAKTQRREEAKSEPEAVATGLTSVYARLDAMQGFANDGRMIPEQVWDKSEVPKNRDREFVPELKFGEGTGSATPLAWSMAQFIRLAVNLKAGRNLDTPQVVYDRYVLGQKSQATANVTLGVPQQLPRDPERMEALKRMFEGCFFDWRAHQSVLKQNDLAKGLNRSTVIWNCKNGKSLVLFVYRGNAKDVTVAGDFTGWKPSKQAFENFSDDGTIKVYSLELAPNARVEYKFVVDGQWILDSSNPNKVDNGVGGENSVLTMPGYKPTEWDKAVKGFEPRLEAIEIKSKVLGETKKVSVFAVSLNSTEPNYQPALYIEDGSDYVKRAKALEVWQNLVTAKRVRPFIMVFIDPKDRNKEYWANDQWADFVANEVVPEIDKRYSTIKTRDGRALLGASLGGVTSIWTALRHPDVFGRVGGQSSSFWIDDERVVKALEKLDGKTKFRFYLDDGALEGVDDSRKVVKILRNKGFDVTYNEAEAGHNWTAWRDRLADAFVALWK